MNKEQCKLAIQLREFTDAIAAHKQRESMKYTPAKKNSITITYHPGIHSMLFEYGSYSATVCLRDGTIAALRDYKRITPAQIYPKLRDFITANLGYMSGVDNTDDAYELLHDLVNASSN